MRFLNYFLTLLIVTSIALISCTPEDKPGEEKPIPDEPSKEEPVYGGTIEINGKAFDISSAGYYHSTDFSGFDIIFTESELDLSKSLTKVPEGVSFCLDVPDVDMNGKSNLPTIIQGDNWSFFFTYVLDGKPVSVDGKYDVRSSSVKEGTLFINLKDGVMELDFSAKANNGDIVKCKYLGKPTKSSEYLLDWYPLTD